MKKIFMLILLVCGFLLVACTPIDGIEDIIKDPEKAYKVYSEAIKNMQDEKMDNLASNLTIDLKADVMGTNLVDLKLDNDFKYSSGDDGFKMSNKVMFDLQMPELITEDLSVLNDIQSFTTIVEEKDGNKSYYLNVDDMTMRNLLINYFDEIDFSEYEATLSYNFDATWLKFSDSTAVNIGTLFEEIGYIGDYDITKLSPNSMLEQLDLNKYLSSGEHKTIEYSAEDENLKVSLTYDKTFVEKMLEDCYNYIVDTAIEEGAMLEENKIEFADFTETDEYSYLEAILNNINFKVDVLIDISSNEIIELNIDLDLKQALNSMLELIDGISYTSLVNISTAKMNLTLNMNNVNIEIPNENVQDLNKVIDDMVKISLYDKFYLALNQMEIYIDSFPNENYTFMELLANPHNHYIAELKTLDMVIDIDKTTFYKVDNKFVVEAYYRDGTKIFVERLGIVEIENSKDLYEYIIAQFDESNFKNQNLLVLLDY